MRKKEQWDPESADRVYFSSTTRHWLQELGSPVSSDSQSFVSRQLMAVTGEFKNKAKRNKSKNKPMGSNKTDKILHSKGTKTTTTTTKDNLQNGRK